jgi:hypothetical protein
MTPLTTSGWIWFAVTLANTLGWLSDVRRKQETSQSTILVACMLAWLAWLVLP